MELPLISVIIVTWNRKKDILDTVQSIYDQAYQNVEIIVVDNGSIDGTPEAVRQTYPQVRLVALSRNAGATGGRNAGISIAQGDILFLLDSDASLHHNTLSKIAHKFQVEPDLGIIGCKVINAYSNQLDGAEGWIFAEKDKAEQDLEFLSYSFGETGSAVRKQVLDQVGPFWDMLFFGREGDDLSLRAWDAGYQVRYYPEAVVYHRVSPLKRVIGGEREYYDLRNSLYIYLVRYPWWMLLGFVPLKVGTSLIKGIRRGYLPHILLALRDVARQLSSLWKQRQPISNQTALYYMTLQRQHGPLRWDLMSWLRYKT
jgi:hypothetical protein